MTWTREKPNTAGWWWVWQPQTQWPCRGRVHCVPVSTLLGTLEAQVPGMDYADDLNENTWDGAMWLGPIAEPAPPDPA